MHTRSKNAVDAILFIWQTQPRLMDQETSTVKDDLVYGVVEEALPNALFRVTVEGEEEPVLA